MKGKKKKHHACSYMKPSPDGRRKSTIKLHEEKMIAQRQISYMEKMSKEVSNFIDMLIKY